MIIDQARSWQSGLTLKDRELAASVINRGCPSSTSNYSCFFCVLRAQGPVGVIIGVSVVEKDRQCILVRGAFSRYVNLVSLCTALQGRHCLAVVSFPTFLAIKENNNTR